MQSPSHIPRYNQPIRQMLARTSSGLRIGFPHSSFLVLLRLAALLFGALLLPSLLFASNLGDTARQLADRIAAVSGPGTLTLEITNHSALDEKSVREIRSGLQVQLRVQGVSTAAADQSMGSLNVVFSESLREYVWTAEIAIGSDQPRVVLVSVPRDLSAAPLSSVLPITLKKALLFSQARPILDAALVEMPGGARLLVLDATRVATYRQQSGHWEIEASLPISSARPFPRDTRGRLLLRRDHLFDAYLPGTICRSSAAAPLTVNCSPSDDPWPLTSEDNGTVPSVRAFFAPTRNFFTGVLSPGIGKISTVPPFYSAASFPRPNYTLWVLAAVDGSVHLIDSINDQANRGARIGSDVAGVRSSCGLGAQFLVSENGDSTRDSLRAFEIPDRDPVAVSSALEFDGPITALWSDAGLTSAVAIVKREDTGWYEANRISVTCTN
ncbi:MAG: hypothetical protein WCC04_09725 [Terriglobales bacterium]